MPQSAEIDIYEKLREYIKRSGKTQRQLSDEVGIPQPSYLSHMANGRVNWVEGEYFRPLSEALKLSKEEIRELKPEIIWEDRTPRSGPPIPPRLPSLEIPLEIPPGLQEAIDRYSGIHPEFTIEKNLRAITSIYRYGGGTDFTPEEWLDIMMANRRWLVKN